MALSWDIFCTVIDNFGDVGVCWRLARQLAHERGEPVRLWVDDLASFAVLRPNIDVHRAAQAVDGVDLRHWAADMPLPTPHAVVIEAFACNPPDEFIAAMAARLPRPVWINLEYLSAEDWVAGCHRLSGRHPRHGLSRHFFFPGFDAHTGGLLREGSLLAARAGFDARQRAAFLASLGMADAPSPLLSLFCYDNPALPALLECWSQGEPLAVAVAEGKPRRQVETWLGEPFAPGTHVQRGTLALHALPFLSQADYDRLLWCCDLNFVRGEDSFVRAQWAAQPLVWHIYPQDDEAHLDKLDAFLARYRHGLPAALDCVQTAFWQAWNAGDAAATVEGWPTLRTALPALARHARHWQASQAAFPDLASQLAAFATFTAGQAAATP